MNTPEQPFDAENRDETMFAEPELLSPDNVVLYELIAKHYANNPGAMFANPDYASDAMLFDWAQALHEYCGRPEDSENSWRAMYGALHFALRVGDIRLMGKQLNLGLGKFERRVGEHDETTPQVIDEIATEYFDSHPDDEQLLHAFIREIDPTGWHTYGVERVCGFILDAIEEADAMQYTRQELEQIEKDLLEHLYADEGQ